MLHMKFGFDWRSGFSEEIFEYYGNIRMLSQNSVDFCNNFRLQWNLYHMIMHMCELLCAIMDETA